MNLFSKMAITIVLSVLTTHSAIAYHNNSPYTWCGGNPIKFVDPDGKDYWTTNDREQILLFLNAVYLGQNQFDFSMWSHAIDADLCGNLVYNDESHKFYVSQGEIIDGEIVVVGSSFDANLMPVSASGMGYPGAFVYEPAEAFLEKVCYFIFGWTYDDGISCWNVNQKGRITGAVPLTGMPPSIGFKGGKVIEKMGRAIRNMSGNRNVQQKQVDQLCRKYKLTKAEREELHQYIHGEGYGYHEIENAIKELFRK